MFCNHDGMKGKTNYRKKNEKSANNGNIQLKTSMDITLKIVFDEVDVFISSLVLPLISFLLD